jgi:hypothetical protein
MRPAWLNRFRHGFDLNLATTPDDQGTTPPNYSSLDDYVSLVNEQLDLLLATGVLEEVCDPVELARMLFHPIGAVSKSSPTGCLACRIIVDTSITRLNGCISDTFMQLPCVRSILNAARPGYFMCSFDLQSGFHHLPVSASVANLLGIRTPSGKHCRFRFICFGLKIAPFWFQGTMMELRRMLIDLGIDCFIAVYIDDWILMAPSVDKLNVARALFRHVLTSMGFLLNGAKETEPSQVMEYTGITIDLLRLRLSLSPAKCAKTLDKVLAFRQEAARAEPSKPAGCTHIKLLDSLVGKLNHLAFVVPGGRAKLRPLWQCSAAWEVAAKVGRPQGARAPRRGPRANATISNACLRALDWWEQLLRKPAVP